MAECRNLTDQECAQIALETGVEMAVVQQAMQDPNFCPFHEFGVATFFDLCEYVNQPAFVWPRGE